MESYRSMLPMKHKPYNPWKSMAARSIQQELEKMQSNPSDDFKCLALESNPRDWQFAIRGPNGTEFEGGIYHGRIKIPEEYPHKPPIITLLTENGRFKTQTEINIFYWGPEERGSFHSFRDIMYASI
ncbi:ubiquitin-conjugating enzyme E2 32-like [Prunus dulcis]|uniref:ubiquitin-conjugating enzyme E2 32-like n=1 Tax=Prunus dulcis TaxID=3755 RepID=UPI0014827CB4|nr:ubiquitin-conjugating enzyme E2 32-like [Prunus dulcis]